MKISEGKIERVQGVAEGTNLKQMSPVGKMSTGTLELSVLRRFANLDKECLWSCAEQNIQVI